MIVTEVEFYKACKNGKIVDTTELLSDKTFINARRILRAGITIAILSDNSDIVKHIIKQYDENLDTKNNKGRTFAMDAAMKNNLPLLKYFIEKYNNIDSVDNNGQTILNVAVQYNSIDVIKYLVEECNIDLNTIDNFGNSLLMISASNGSIDIVKYFVEVCRVNIKNENGFKSLILAISNNHLNIVKYFVEVCNFDINMRDKYRKTPLIYALMSESYDVIIYLISINKNIYREKINKDNDLLKKTLIC